MNRQTNIEVIINGKRYTLSGYESEEYMQKVASYINKKYDEFKKHPSYRTMDVDMRNVLMQINLTDDYLKLKQQMSEKESDSDSKSGEIFELKHEIISLQTRIATLEKELEHTKQERYEEEKKNIRLETELNELRKK
ncbi:MAG: cell division protein ZapA [Lachnospiraceae bacterium]|nr:cell division protein ZapA [Lachnospiraceae bacterium]